LRSARSETGIEADPQHRLHAVPALLDSHLDHPASAAVSDFPIFFHDVKVGPKVEEHDMITDV
jgi:hypothetical protein